MPISPFRVIGDVVYVSGQIAIDNSKIVSEDFAEQARFALTRLIEVVRSAGGDRSTIVKCTCVLTEQSNLASFNAVYRAIFEGVDPYPARTTIIAGLPHPQALVEVEAIATL